MVHQDIQWTLRKEKSQDWQIRAELSPKWIRVKFGDEIIADSKKVIIVTETGKLPVYYFPQSDVKTDALVTSEYTTANQHKGKEVYWDIKVGDRIAKNAVWSYPNPPEKSAFLLGYLSFNWKSVDAWYEEEEEVFVHARDPYTRVDAIPSTRHIQIIIDGIIVADSKQPVIVYETGLTPRYYLPKEDIRFDLLTPTETSTRCPYKGNASYWSITVNGKIYKDVVWAYKKPLSEVHEIAGLLSFYHELVDTIQVDGEVWAIQNGDRLPYKNV